MLVLFFIPLILFFVQFNSGAEICTATSITSVVSKINNNSSQNKTVVFNYTNIIQIQTLKNHPLVQVMVTNVTTNSADASKYHLTSGKEIMAQIDGKRAQSCTSIGGICSWLVDNTTITISLPLTLDGEVGTVTLVNNIVDGGGINNIDGQYFDHQQCTVIEEETSNFINYSFENKQCCVEFQTVPDPSAPMAECQAFSGSATFYKKGVAFANVNATFNKFGNGYNIVIPPPTGPQNSYYSLTENRQFGCYGKFGSGNSCGTLLPMTTDYKVLYPLDIWKPAGQTWSYSINFGRIISRNGTFEKEEGVRFTPISPCLYHGERFDDTYTATSQFCCQQF